MFIFYSFNLLSPSPCCPPLPSILRPWEFPSDHLHISPPLKFYLFPFIFPLLHTFSFQHTLQVSLFIFRSDSSIKTSVTRRKNTSSFFTTVPLSSKVQAAPCSLSVLIVLIVLPCFRPKVPSETCTSPRLDSIRRSSRLSTTQPPSYTNIFVGSISDALLDHRPFAFFCFLSETITTLHLISSFSSCSLLVWTKL